MNNLATENVRLVSVSFRKDAKSYFLPKPNFRLKLFDEVVVSVDGELKFARIRRPLVIMDVRRWDIIRERSITGKILRLATSKDILYLKKLEEKEKEAFLICKEKIKHYGLPMHLIETIWDEKDKKYIFYFTANSRVDFRELVKDLAKTFNKKIQLWQVGARDAMRFFSGYGPCGLPLCCNTFLNEIESVELVYTRMQHLPPNPAKVTGGCGKLVCCLRYELDIKNGKNN